MLGVQSGLLVSAHLQVGYQVRWAAAEDAHLAGPGVSSAAGVVSLQQVHMPSRAMACHDRCD